MVVVVAEELGEVGIKFVEGELIEMVAVIKVEFFAVINVAFVAVIKVEFVAVNTVEFVDANVDIDVGEVSVVDKLTLTLFPIDDIAEDAYRGS